MNHSVEVIAYVLNNPNDIEYDEVPLEVIFDMEDNSWEITNHLLNGKSLKNEDMKELYKNNPGLERRIERKIDHYITNYEEEFHDFDR